MIFCKLDSTMQGKVYLIGAGPGDPGLLTLKGRAILSKADAIVYDALINPQLLKWAKRGAQKIFVGKRGPHHFKEQEEINSILGRLASRDRIVARLKGGDPFMFARGGEEAEFLSKSGIPFEIVPGVTSALGAAAYAGIPLTHRSFNSMVTFVTGFEGRGKRSTPVEWSRIPRESTLVIFMGSSRLSGILDRLRRHGWDPKTPAAAIEWGTLPQQRVAEGTLTNIADEIGKTRLSSPLLIVVGKVVSLRKTLRWFDRRPLDGKSIVITRAADQAADFSRRLSEAGAETISFPTIRIAPPRRWNSVDRAIQELRTYDWVLFTSVNGVTMFFDRLKARGRGAHDLKNLRIGAIGPKTCARLEEFGLKVDSLPEEYRAEALADAVGSVKGLKILLARAEQAREILPETLRKRGAYVDVVTVYRTLKPQRLPPALKHRFFSGEIDVVTFTSSSTVDGFMQHFTSHERRRIFKITRAAAIGPITAATLLHHGVNPKIIAKKFTTEDLARAIEKHYA
jgi:uroporphyrinogen III methyltransferase/synthase